MKSAVIITTGRPGPDASSLEWREAFAAGLRRRGWTAEISTAPKLADLVVLWGVRRRDLIARQKLAGGEVCILERGYLGDRFAWTSVSFGGGLNGRGVFRGPLDDASRFEAHFAPMLKPWRAPSHWDAYALVIGQVPGDQSIRGQDIEGWYRRTVAALREHGWTDIRFRPHPKASRVATGPAGVPVLAGELQADLAGAGLVVTFNSNTGVDAALAGRPVIAADAGSMAWDVAGHALEDILRPDRAAWAARLAWCQYTRAEIESGFCQEAVGL